MNESGRLDRLSGLKNQIERAVVSISNNVAEGFERGTTAELLTFLYIARGSAGEVRSMLCLLERVPAFDDLNSEISDLKSRATSVSRQLGAWIESLKNSEITGTRHMNDKKRDATEASRRRDAFLDEMKRIASRPSPELEDDSRLPPHLKS